jgi:lysophospholipase L1-like esterase
MRIIAVVIFFFIALRSEAQVVPWDTIPNLPDHYNERLAEFKKQKVTTGKIMFLGNSITEMGDFKKLTGDTTIINRGIGGDITFGILNRIDEIVRFKPSKVFILIGINDLSKHIPERVILQNMFSIVNQLKAASPKTQVFIQSILPVNPTVKQFPNGYDVNESVVVVNTQLSNISKRLKFTFIDLHKRFCTIDGVMDPKYTTDGLHLNASGYQLWVKILKDGKHL